MSKDAFEGHFQRGHVVCRGAREKVGLDVLRGGVAERGDVGAGQARRGGHGGDGRRGEPAQGLPAGGELVASLPGSREVVLGLGPSRGGDDEVTLGARGVLLEGGDEAADVGAALGPVGDVDAPHAFTFTPDLTRAMLRAADLPGEGHELVMAPNAGSVSMRELATITAAAADRPVPQLKPYSIPMLRMVGLFSSMVREITDVAHQFTRPFEVETAASEVRLGMSATPWAQAAAETVAWWRSR